MSLEDIKKSISEETEKKIKELSQATEIKISAINKEWQKKIQDREIEIIERVKDQAKRKMQQLKFLAKTQTQAQIMNKKQQIIAKVFDSALAKLGTISDDEYVSLMEKLISKLPASDGNIYSVAGKEKLLAKALAKKAGDIVMADKSVPGSGGFIFKTNEIEIDNRFEALVKNQKEKLIVEFSKILFK